MNRRRMLLVTSAGALAVLAVGLWLISPASSAITRANAAQVQKGMTLEEVETILGGPAR